LLASSIGGRQASLSSSFASRLAMPTWVNSSSYIYVVGTSQGRARGFGRGRKTGSGEVTLHYGLI
jgi:hypothetical protein